MDRGFLFFGVMAVQLALAGAACSGSGSAGSERREAAAAATAPCRPLAPQSSAEELAGIPLAERETYPSAAIRAHAASFRGGEREIIRLIFSWMNDHLVSLEQTDRWKKLDSGEERDLARHSLLCARTADEIVRSGYFFGCGEIAMVFLAMSKAAGLKTRFFHAADEAWSERNDAGHAFAEVYLAGERRWLLVDPTRRIIHEDYAGADRFRTSSGFLVAGRSEHGYWDLRIYGYRDLKDARRAAMERLRGGAADAGPEVVLAGDFHVAICSAEDVGLMRERFQILQAFSGDRGVEHFRKEIDTHPVVIALTLEKRDIITGLNDALLPMPYQELIAALERGETVVRESERAGGRVLLFGAPTRDGLAAAIRSWKDE